MFPTLVWHSQPGSTDSIQRLKSLTFLAPIKVNIVDDDFIQMARSRPELVELHIDWRTSNDELPTATLVTLEAFAS